MNTPYRTNGHASVWPIVTDGRPCPKCHKTNRCTLAPDGQAGHCWRKGETWNEKPTTTRCTTTPAPTTPRAKPRTLTYSTREAAVDAVARRVKGEAVATYRYADPDGLVVFVVVRFNLPDGGKQFRPFHKVDGGWRAGDPTGPLPLFKLPDLMVSDTDTVFVCEGEKACNAPRALGLTATTSAHGAASAAKSDWSPLAGRDVVILPDADEPGERYARDVCRLLLSLTPPAAVRIVGLPGLPAGGDVVEFIAARPDADPADVAAEIEKLADAVPLVERDQALGGPIVVHFNDVVAREVDWLWEGRIALGRLTLLVGVPGAGKSFATCDFASRVSTGSDWPDGSPCRSGEVLLIAAEDDPADTIRPRLDACGANVHRVALLRSVRHVGDDGKPIEVLFTLADLPALETALSQLPNCRLIIVDPIGSFLGGQVDAHRDNDVRAVLAPLAMLAERTNVAVLIVAHRRKGTSGTADETALGSRAFTGIVRAVHHLSRDPNDKNRRLLLPGKNNLAPEGDGLAFTIEGQPVGSVVWEADPVKLSADEALAQEGGNDGRPGPPATAHAEAAAWLREVLADHVGHPVAEVRASAEAAGMGWRSVQRARESMGVAVSKGQFSGGWVWRMPEPGEGGAS